MRKGGGEEGGSSSARLAKWGGEWMMYNSEWRRRKKDMRMKGKGQQADLGRYCALQKERQERAIKLVNHGGGKGKWRS